MDIKDVGAYYTRDGEDIWQMFSYCEYPTATLVNLKTGEKIGGAVNSLIFESFQKLVPEQRPNMGNKASTDT